MRTLLLSIVFSGLGCASTNALATKDEVFVRAQERIVRTAQQVDQERPSELERERFMQAEGFYQYRFAFPTRGVLSYLAQGAAAITDLPALQSLAGSLDLADLRLRSSDGAIHLWESLLAEYPQTSLRAMALYRLGWAYRTAGATGFPRASGDEAFELLVKEQPKSPLAILAKEAQAAPWKSKDKATAFSLVPGLGQFYVGEPGNGTVRLAIAIASLGMVVVPIYVAAHRPQELSWSKDWPLLVLGLGGLVILSMDYTAAYQDALRGVVEFNERREAEFQERHPEAP